MADPKLGLTDVVAIARHFRLQWEEVQQAWVLLYPEGMVKLSETAGEILKRVDGTTPVSGIVSNLEQAFPGVDLSQDVLDFLEVANEHGWIRPKTQ